MSKLPRRLRELDKLLDEFPLDSDAMMLTDLDGLIAGLLVCPDVIPPSVWLPSVVGETESGAAAFDGIPQGRKLLDLVLQHYNATATDLLEGSYSPVFDHFERSDETVWEGWMEGFATAVALSPESWGKFEEADEETRAAFTMMTILAVVANPDEPLPEGVTPLTEEEMDALYEEAPDLIAQSVLMLSAWTRARDAARATPPDFEAFTAQKVGRNEPCPCGSGKKYKKCCALKEAEALAVLRARTAAA